MPRTMTTQLAYAAVRREAEKIRNGDPADVPAMEPGDVLRQGDLYVTCLDRDIADRGPARSRQLAPGTTQGSRHVVEGDCDVLTVDEDSAAKVIGRLVPATKAHRQFFGPLIRARGPVTITHPEHGHRTLPGPATYLVTYQRTWADEVRRTED